MTGFQYLWYNYCQRNFSATSGEMIWELAQYGTTTNSNFGVYAHPGSRGGTYGSRKAMQFMLMRTIPAVMFLVHLIVFIF